MKFRKGQGELDRTSTFRGGHRERRWGVPFFQGSCTFHIKNKLKSEIFNDKKDYKQKYFSLSLLKIQTGKLPENSVIFKR